MNYIKLSKEISYALRHAPWEYELELDEFGWVELDLLLGALKLDPIWKDLTIPDIEEMIIRSEKKRHELSGNNIRALYGHTTPEKIILKEQCPPDILYHGTAKCFLTKIKKDGLLPMGRHYVHLSINKKIAQRVGKRKDPNPVILSVDSKQAYTDGCKFYMGNDKIWLSDFIMKKYIRFDE